MGSGHESWKSHPMGETNLSKAKVKEILGQLRKEWRRAEHGLLRHVRHVPDWVTSHAAACSTRCNGVFASAAATHAAAIIACAMADKVDQRLESEVQLPTPKTTVCKTQAC